MSQPGPSVSQIVKASQKYCRERWAAQVKASWDKFFRRGEWAK